MTREYSNIINIDIAKEIKKRFISLGNGTYFFDEGGVKWKRSEYYFEMVNTHLEGKSREN